MRPVTLAQIEGAPSDSRLHTTDRRLPAAFGQMAACEAEEQSSRADPRDASIASIAEVSWPRRLLVRRRSANATASAHGPIHRDLASTQLCRIRSGASASGRGGINALRNELARLADVEADSRASLEAGARAPSKLAPPVRHQRASGACSFRASALIEAAVRAGHRRWSQGHDEGHRPPNRALLLSASRSRRRGRARAIGLPRLRWPPRPRMSGGSSRLISDHSRANTG